MNLDVKNENADRVNTILVFTQIPSFPLSFPIHDEYQVSMRCHHEEFFKEN